MRWREHRHSGPLADRRSAAVMKSFESGLFERLEAAGCHDAVALAAEFARDAHCDYPDRFLAWLHERQRISSTLFAELAGHGAVAVARFLGVRDKTLLMAPAPARTLLLPSV